MTVQASHIQVTVNVEKQPEDVWELLVTQQGLRGWLRAQLFVLEIDDNGLLETTINRGGTAVTVRGETSFIHPPQMLIFTWIEKDHRGREWDYPTLVSIELKPADFGTQFTLTHKGLNRLPETIRDAIISQYKRFWENKVEHELPTTIR